MNDGHVSDAAPCRDCPWRLDNQRGRTHPDGWFTAKNRDRLWTRLRRGDAMSCHRTDPSNPVSQAAAERGYRPVPEGTQVLECRGAVILQQREMHLLMNRHDMDIAGYTRARPRGLTRAGITALVLRMAFGGVPIVGGPAMGRPDLDAEVGHTPLQWDESCIKDIMQETENGK
jgi:hypothetical protein